MSIVTPTTLLHLPSSLSPPTCLYPPIGKICHGAAELLHSYFCCVQWHASAFDERLEDDAFLHAQTLRGHSTTKATTAPIAGEAAATSPAPPLSSIPETTAAVANGTDGFGLDSGGSGRDCEVAAGGEGEQKNDHVCSTSEEVAGAATTGAGEADRDPRVDVLQKLLVRQRRALWDEIQGKMVRYDATYVCRVGGRFVLVRFPRFLFSWSRAVSFHLASVCFVLSFCICMCL